MRDIVQEADVENRYECFNCGNVVVAMESPGPCPECGGEMRNRTTPLE
jgi:rubrerythrin